MCSDFWPHGEVSERYGVFSKSGDDAGASERAVVIVDPTGRVAFRKKYGHEQVAPVEDVFTALKII